MSTLQEQSIRRAKNLGSRVHNLGTKADCVYEQSDITFNRKRLQGDHYKYVLINKEKDEIKSKGRYDDNVTPTIEYQ